MSRQPEPGIVDAPELDEVRRLLARAATGDRDALPPLRALLDGRPGVWERLGDLAAHVRLAWVDRIGRSDVAVKEALARKAEVLRGELARAGAGPLERLLIDRVVATWLEVHAADLDAAGAGDVLPEKVELALKRQEAAGRRHARAIESLANVRRLLPAGEASSPDSGAQPAEAGVSEGEPVDVVPFETASGSRRSSDRAIPAGGSRPRRRARRT